MTSYTPTNSAKWGAKTTRLPTAAAPANLWVIVRLPVETDESNLREITSYTPTTLAWKGAKTTRLPTATAPANL
eukprot:440982-Prymnesium_polylepis.1